MGSDLSMSPPSPDEYRLVRQGDYTAVYYRHTDGIYRGGTSTWFRKTCHYDPNGTVLNALRETNRYRVTTLPEHKHRDGVSLPLEAPLDFIGEPDFDYDGEEKRLKAARDYAERDLARAQEKFLDAVAAQAAFVALREREASHDQS